MSPVSRNEIGVVYVNPNSTIVLYFVDPTEVLCKNETHCDFELPQVFQNITRISIQNLCEFVNVIIQIEIYQVTCKYYNTTENIWQQNGVYSGIQEQKNVSICLTNHLTTFGALTVPRLVSS